MHISTLRRRGYAVKASTVGHWVDGRFGYLVAGYYPSQKEAVTEAGRRIVEAERTGTTPAWLLQ